MGEEHDGVGESLSADEEKREAHLHVTPAKTTGGVVESLAARPIDCIWTERVDGLPRPGSSDLVRHSNKCQCRFGALIRLFARKSSVHGRYYFCHSNPNLLRSDSVPETWTLVTHLCNIFFALALHQMIFFALFTPRIQHAEVRPQDRVADNGESDHGHGNGVTFDEARAFLCRVQLAYVSACDLYR